MSKGTVRFPESAIAGGRVGTARIREQIAGAAARLESTLPIALDQSLRTMTADNGADPSFFEKSVFGVPYSPSPIERMQQLGRLGTGRMNKSEAAYAQLLNARRACDEIADFEFESIKFRLANRTWYTPDFCVYLPSGSMEIHEVKGFMTDDANVKLKVAAEMYSQHVFRLIRKGKKGTWTITTISAR